MHMGKNVRWLPSQDIVEHIALYGKWFKSFHWNHRHKEILSWIYILDGSVYSLSFVYRFDFLMTAITVKESLINNGQQFHQHPQNEQLLFTSSHWTQNIPHHIFPW